MPEAKHLLSVWNPTYSEAAMDVHLRQLLQWAERFDNGDVRAEDVYVWWAKLRSPRRGESLPHTDEVLALDAQIKEGTETHLYLSDYRALYVGHLVEITAEDLPTTRPQEKGHIPDYVLEHEVDFWFRLQDLRLVVSGDLKGTVKEIRKLLNVRDNDRPISIYGGIFDVPLIVRRDPPAAWFTDKEDLTGGRLWAKLEAELRGESHRVARQLRDNLFGAELWWEMEPASRTFLTSAEAVYRSRRDDPGFDFSACAIEYGKAVEVELNALIFPALRKLVGNRSPKQREVHGLHSRLDLGKRVPHQSLGAIGHLLNNESAVKKGIQAALPMHAPWLLSEAFKRQIGDLIQLRNPAAHWEIITSEMVSERRHELLGIGCEGFLVRLVRAKVQGQPRKNRRG